MHAAPPSALLAGDPAFDPELAPGLGRLPAAQREVANISEVYAPLAEPLLGSNATVERFLARARDKSIVHFAGHSIVNPREPSRSLLLLAPSATHRGALEARELLTKLDLRRTRLVFLSACSSAGGYPVGPEGVAPLVRPLIAAGVPAVAGSLWDVEDATAGRVSVSFHRRY
jgi:CHAT domain-containing protein